jgi:hypothetical protein
LEAEIYIPDRGAYPQDNRLKLINDRDNLGSFHGDPQLSAQSEEIVQSIWQKQS